MRPGGHHQRGTRRRRGRAARAPRGQAGPERAGVGDAARARPTRRGEPAPGAARDPRVPLVRHRLRVRSATLHCRPRSPRTSSTSPRSRHQRRPVALGGAPDTAPAVTPAPDGWWIGASCGFGHHTRGTTTRRPLTHRSVSTAKAPGHAATPQDHRAKDLNGYVSGGQARQAIQVVTSIENDLQRSDTTGAVARWPGRRLRPATSPPATFHPRPPCDGGVACWYAGMPRSSSTVTKRYPRSTSASIVTSTASTVSARTPPRALNPS